MIVRAGAGMALCACILSLAGCAASRRGERGALRSLERAEGTLIHQEEMRSADIVWRVRVPTKVVALTFDDGPDPKYTPTVLKLARDRRLRLTFFLVGREIQLHSDLAKREVAEGHAVGNHSWDHPTMTYDSQRQDISEIERCEDEIEKICGERTHLFRPPKGLWDGDTFVAAEALGYRMILWSVALEHHSAKTPQAMAERVIRKVRPGMIILAHDGEPCHPIDRSKTMKALPILVEGLQREGYRFVTIPELLKMGGRGR
jgi:peptidoglycan/xylan/chitin deacetylase (PgdA/CDA1 family)